MIDVRSTRILLDIKNEENRLMACGDVRSAVILKNSGYIKLVTPRKREFISSYTLTDKGEQYLVYNTNNNC